MDKTYDVAVIGGGPGGACAGAYLRKLGYAVVILEKEKFPRDHVGESLIPYCYHKLKDLGLLDEVKKIATRKPGVNFVDKDGERQSVWCFDNVLEDGSQMTFHMLRAPFDKMLLDHAAHSGANVMEEHTVKDADLSDNKKVVLRVAGKNGEEKIITARFLIDASGQNSFLAKKTGTRVPYEQLDRVAFFTHWVNTKYDDALNSGLIKIVYLGGEKKGWIWVIPVGRNHLSIGVTLNNAYVREQKKKFPGKNWADDFYLNEIAESPALNRILQGASREHDVQVMGDYSYYVEKKFGENYALVGDAGAFLDPIFSSGIYVAMETADRMAKCIDVKFREGDAAGRKSFEEQFVHIEGGYKLIEKFVRLFYDPELMNFSHADPRDDGYRKYLNAYNVFHYLLAGDFFTHYKKYSEFIDTLTQEKNYNQFLYYVRKKAREFSAADFCKYTFDEIYGHLPEEDKVAPGMLAGKKH